MDYKTITITLTESQTIDVLQCIVNCIDDSIDTKTSVRLQIIRDSIRKLLLNAQK